MSRINFNHFYYFYEVARHRGFTAAARELMISQSALSVQIRNLEESLGGALFDRTKSGVELTEIGQMAYQVAERVFQDLDQLVSDLRETERRVTGVLSVGTVNSIGIYVLPEVLVAFRKQFPDVDVRIDFKEGEDVIDLLYSAKADFAIAPWNRRYGDLISIPLRDVKLFLVTPPDHPLARQAKEGMVSPREIAACPFVGYESGMHTRNLTDSLFKRMGMDIEYAIESSNAATIKHMVMAGMGVALVPEFAVAGELRRGQLARIDTPTLTVSQEITLYFRKNRTLSRMRGQFAQFLQDYFAPPRRRHAEPA